jgi:hypothetical protein
MRLLLAVFGLLILGAGAAHADGKQEEIPLPVFDHGPITATYVISTPSKWNGREPLPLILDLHGAIQPSKRGGSYTSRALWAKFVERVPCIVAAPNGRTRGWNSIKGEHDDRAYLQAVMKDVRGRHPVAKGRVYLSGFSSGSDFACTGGLQPLLDIDGTLVICPGPPNVVGIRNGSLGKLQKQPFVFATGEEDYIRKSGAFDAYEHILSLGGTALYREVPDKGHVFFGMDEYVRLFEDLERLVNEPKKVDWLSLAEAALEREDYLAAARYAGRARKKQQRKADAVLKKLDAARDALLEAAGDVPSPEHGRAYEAWWHVRTQFRADKVARKKADEALAALAESMSGRDLLRARRDYFKSR